MLLSDVSIKRPVVALVASILVVLIGLLSFARLPVREYPLIDSPVVTVETNFCNKNPFTCHKTSESKGL